MGPEGTAAAPSPSPMPQSWGKQRPDMAHSSWPYMHKGTTSAFCRAKDWQSEPMSPGVKHQHIFSFHDLRVGLGPLSGGTAPGWGTSGFMTDADARHLRNGE